MNEARRSRRDSIQNIAIALLSVLAVLLFLQSQRFSLSPTEGALLSPSSSAPISTAPLGQSTPLTLPVRAAVTGSYGRYGSVTLTTEDESFEPLRSLLEQALGSARSLNLCSIQAFRDALQAPSLYCDFLSTLPLPILAEAVWTSSEHSLQARYLVLSGQGDTVSLYFWDGASLSYRCDTDLSSAELETAVNRYDSGNAHFAYDLPEEAGELAPFSLLPDALPELPVLSAAAALSDTNRLLTLLDFNPNTNYRYPESDGSETVIEGERSVRIRPNGTVTYSSGGESALVVRSQSDRPTAREAASGASALLNELLASVTSDAKLYLTGIQQTGSTTTVTFDYQVSGIPVCFADGTSAAEVVLDGVTVSGMTLRFRQYTAAGNTSLLLPLPQALAIAASRPGQELSIGYADTGSETVSACWLANEL